MKKFCEIKLVSAIVTTALVAACGLGSASDESRQSNSLRQAGKTSGKSCDFSGSYKVSGEGYENVTLKIKDEGNHYTLEWLYPESERATGVEFSGYLIASTPGENGIVGIYEKDGGRITGLWLEDGEYLSESSKGARTLKTSGHDFSGTYVVHSNQVGDEEAYTYGLTIEKNSGLYSATAAYEDGSLVSDEVVAVDNIIVVGYPVDGRLVTHAYKLNGSRLDCKFFYPRPDYQTGLEELFVGTEIGEKD
ncbi:hypothetical protein GX441_12740 [bacterium]|nr:hypothetical protein [bacterium]